eukprot:TRINITY_DN1693_c0_g1_i2.p1 TRINITY_DN1693_c0_g1~~TRINITY_DN1693_c0_g1_i2.p1  ORF type:complete len:244 (+),score=37.96 TRINITY_DN1693_c0_g1_i2:101-733(+)
MSYNYRVAVLGLPNAGKRAFLEKVKRWCREAPQPDDEAGKFNEGTPISIFEEHIDIHFYHLNHQSDTTVRHWPDDLSKFSALLYIASLSDFDQFSPDDPSRNLLCDALDEFERMCDAVPNLPVVLVLSQYDEFQRKCWNGAKLGPFFSGSEPSTVDQACNVAKERFEARARKGRDRAQYTAFGSGDGVSSALSILKDFAIRDSLRKSSFW